MEWWLWRIAVAVVGFMLGYWIGRTSGRHPSRPRCVALTSIVRHQDGKCGRISKRCDLDADHEGPHHVQLPQGQRFDPWGGWNTVWCRPLVGNETHGPYRGATQWQS